MGNQWWLPAKLLLNSSRGWQVCPQASLTGRTASSWCDAVACGQSAAFPPGCRWAKPEAALDVRAKFCLHLSAFTVIHFYFMYSVLLNTTIYHTVIITLEKGSAELQSVDHYESTAWALQKPQTYQGMWSCVCACTILSSLQRGTAQGIKHKCSSFSKWVLNWFVCQLYMWTNAQYLSIFASRPLMSY